MSRVLLHLPPEVYNALWRHLLQKRPVIENAAFVYARQEVENGTTVFRYVEWFPVPQNGFISSSSYHFELTEKTRAAVIKRAHDLGTSLIEFHSHIGSLPARFSPSDRAGFEEFVPHVWWRLKGRPYLAVVVAAGSFDAFVWLTDPRSPGYLDGLVVEKQMFLPTRLSPLQIEAYDDERTF